MFVLGLVLIGRGGPWSSAVLHDFLSLSLYGNRSAGLYQPG